MTQFNFSMHFAGKQNKSNFVYVIHHPVLKKLHFGVFWGKLPKLPKVSMAFILQTSDFNVLKTSNYFGME